MKGIRAFGKNEGSLSHCGDFSMLFSPLLARLEDVAVFHPDLTYSFFYSGQAPEDAEKTMEALNAELERLDLRTAAEKKQPPYYGPGFFPTFVPHIVDDWNELLCFKPPFPEYRRLFDTVFSSENRDYPLFRKRIQSLGAYVYFRNVDACFWECYAPDDDLISEVRQHLIAWRIDFEELDFDQDYPFGGLKKERRFRGVHKIWPPG